MTLPADLMINSGSSSLKASLFSDGARRDFRYNQIGVGGLANHRAAIEQLLGDLGDTPLRAIGHRITHGGDAADQARVIDAQERARLEQLIALAPLHLPANLQGVDLCRPLGALQIACFDTAFHKTLPPSSRRLPVPLACGVERVGFHGLNYGYIASQLPRFGPHFAQKRIAAAHLGNGSSLCLLQGGESIDTSMSWTPLGGVPMGTRSGDLDPGAVLHLLRMRTPSEVENLLWRESGLLALSDGLSSQMNVLIASSAPQARFAVSAYCRCIRKAIGAFAAAQGGIDGLVFTGGIGENAPEVRAQICEPLRCLGFALSAEANESDLEQLHQVGQKPILRLRADEERRMFELVRDLTRTN